MQRNSCCKALNFASVSWTWVYMRRFAEPSQTACRTHKSRINKMFIVQVNSPCSQLLKWHALRHDRKLVVHHRHAQERYVTSFGLRRVWVTAKSKVGNGEEREGDVSRAGCVCLLFGERGWGVKHTENTLLQCLGLEEVVLHSQLSWFHDILSSPP